MCPWSRPARAILAEMSVYSSLARFYDPLRGDASGIAGLLRSWRASSAPSVMLLRAYTTPTDMS